jgi:Xaa-Pro aminopeptidase
MSRLERLAAGLDTRLLVTSPLNIRYLVGFESSNAALLVSPDASATLDTDFRYLEAAQEIEGVTVELAPRSLMRDLAQRLQGAVAFEADATTVSQAQTLAADGLELVPTRGVVEALRQIKDDAEIALIARASLAADRAFEALTAETWVGHSEREVAWRLRLLFHAHGAEELSFDTLIAAGANASRPHAHPSDEIIPERSLVIADFGVRIDGYCSDCTRTVATGELPGELQRIYEICLEAQLAAVAGIRPGMRGVEADRLARSVIENAGYGDQFGHGLGHGVGMEVHESPRLSRESDDTVEVGQVVTVEPGIYLPGVGGVRIEDLAVVTEDGLRLLTTFPKELITVD